MQLVGVVEEGLIQFLFVLTLRIRFPSIRFIGTFLLSSTIEEIHEGSLQSVKH